MLIRQRPRAAVADLKVDEAVAVEFGPSSDAGFQYSGEFVVSEGTLHVGKFQLGQAAPGAQTAEVSHTTGAIFGEVGLVLSGALTLTFGDNQELKVPNEYEWGPFYNVHNCGSLKKLASGHLDYTPHKWVNPSSDATAIFAVCHFEVPDASLEGPHRHCYT